MTTYLRQKFVYKKWYSMWFRCTNPKDPRYADYGGRGITVAEEWKDFERFLADMGPCPTGYTLERKDNNGNYVKGNCCWATRSAQELNKRLKTNNTSGVVGVSFHKGRDGWRAVRGGKTLYSGKDFFEAVCASKSFDAARRTNL